MLKLRSLLKTNKSVFLKWLMSYIFVMFVPIIATMTAYISVERVVRTEITNSNWAMVSMIRQSLDEKLSEAKKLAFRIGAYPELKLLRLPHGVTDPETWYNLGRFADDLSIYASSSSFSESLYVLTHNSNIAFGTAGSTTYELIYGNFHGVDGFTYADWYNMVTENTNAYKFMPSLRNFVTPSNSIAYITQAPMHMPDQYATIVVLINFDKAFFLSQPVVYENMDRQVYIIDENDNIISPSEYGTANILEGLKYADLNEQQQLIHHQNRVVSYIPSQVANMKYIVTVPERVFFHRVLNIRLTMIVCLVLCMVVGLFLSYYLSKKQYNPLKELMSIIDKCEEAKTNVNENEYVAIKSNLQGLIEERDRMVFNYERLSGALRDDYLIKLVKGMLDENEYQELKLEFISSHFAVIALHIDNILQVFDGQTKKPTRQDIKLVYVAIKNILEELIGQNHRGYVFNLDESYLCLANLNQDYASEQAYQELDETLQSFGKLLQKHFYIYITVAVGEIVDELRDVNHAYHTAMEAMQYRVINRQGEIIFYSRLNTGKEKKLLLRPLNNENQLVNCIKICDFQRAQETLEQICEDIFSDAPTSAYAKYLIYHIASLVVKAFAESPINKNTRQEFNIADRLLRCETLLDLKMEIICIFEQLSGVEIEDTVDEKSELKNVIVQYIQDNYQDHSLNVATLGYALNRNAAYISRIIRDYTGDTLLDYISKYRLEKAKELLKDESLRVSDVAIQVGFTNSVGLIRAFKKYEGVTPGEYRKIK